MHQSVPLQQSLLRSLGGVTDCPKARCVLRQCLELAELVVLTGQVKLPPIETKLRMDVGGVVRQALRIGM